MQLRKLISFDRHIGGYADMLIIYSVFIFFSVSNYFKTVETFENLLCSDSIKIIIMNLVKKRDKFQQLSQLDFLED